MLWEKRKWNDKVLCKVLERVNWGERITDQASVMLSCSVGPTPQLFLRPVFYSLPQPWLLRWCCFPLDTYLAKMFPNGPVWTMLIRFLSVWSPKPLLFTPHTSQFHYQAVVGQIFQYDIKRRVINAMVHRLFTNILPDHWYLCLKQNYYFALDFGVVAMKYLLRI